LAENVQITAGSGTTIATDDCTVNAVAVQVQRVKAGWGADSVYNDPAVAAPIPVQNTIETGQLSYLGALVTPQYAVIDTSASGNTTLVAAVTSKVIVVLSYDFVCDGTVAVKFTSGAGGTALTGAQSFAANGGIAKTFSPAGYFVTGSNTALVINLSAAIGVRGSLVYIAR